MTLLAGYKNLGVIQQKEVHNFAPDKYAVAFLIIAALFLLYRASFDERWSKWAEGDAQTLMAAKHTATEGFFNLSFLGVPQGFSTITKLIENEPLKHHAHGSEGKWSGLGPKRLNTKWASWAAVPYGFFAKLGITSKSLYQYWAIILSVMGLLFFYLFCRLVGGPAFALPVLVIYAVSPSFLGYADSLSTMPYDDFFRFACLFSWAAVSRSGNQSLVWIPLTLYLGATLTSIDSILFIPLCAMAYDILVEGKNSWRTWAWFGFPLLISASIQFLQIANYLGAKNAWAEWQGYLVAFSSVSFFERFPFVARLVQRIFYLDYPLVVGLVIAAIVVSHKVHPKLKWLLLVFFVGGAGMAWLFPAKTVEAYQARQMLPFVASTYACLLAAFYSFVSDFVGSSSGVPTLKTRMPAILVIAILPAIIALHFHTDRGNFLDFLDVPPRRTISPRASHILQQVNEQFPGDKVYLQIGKIFGEATRTQGHPQISSLIEYYSEGLYLVYPTLEGLTKDLNYTWSHKDKKFTPIIIFEPSKYELTQLATTLTTLDYPFRLKTIYELNDLVAAVVELEEQPKGLVPYQNFDL